MLQTLRLNWQQQQQQQKMLVEFCNVNADRPLRKYDLVRVKIGTTSSLTEEIYKKTEDVEIGQEC